MASTPADYPSSICDMKQTAVSMVLWNIYLYFYFRHQNKLFLKFMFVIQYDIIFVFEICYFYISFCRLEMWWILGLMKLIFFMFSSHFINVLPFLWPCMNPPFNWLVMSFNKLSNICMYYIKLSWTYLSFKFLLFIVIDCQISWFIFPLTY